MEGSYDLSNISAPLIKTKLPGPKSLEYLNIQQELETKAITYPKQFHIAIRKAKGSTIEDMDGNIFIDWFGGICVLNLGHANPIVLNAIKKQIEDVIHINEVPTEARINFLKSMNHSSPGKLKDHSKILTTTTGADACEAAIKIARAVTKRRTIVAFGGAYHGISGGVVEATANYHYRSISGVSYGNFYHLPFPYKYRFPLKIKEEEISHLLGDQLEYLIRDPYAGPGPIAGVLLEPIQGEGGYVIPPDDFIPIIKEITEKYLGPIGLIIFVIITLNSFISNGIAEGNSFTRAAFAMARENIFYPQKYSVLNKYGSPSRILAIQFIFTVATAYGIGIFVGPFEAGALLSGFNAVFLYIIHLMMNASLPIYGKRKLSVKTKDFLILIFAPMASMAIYLFAVVSVFYPLPSFPADIATFADIVVIVIAIFVGTFLFKNKSKKFLENIGKEKFAEEES